MSTHNSVKEGWDYAASFATGGAGAGVGNSYVQSVAEAIQKLNDDMNKYAGHRDSVATLKGFAAEEWHADNQVAAR